MKCRLQRRDVACHVSTLLCVAWISLKTSYTKNLFLTFFFIFVFLNINMITDCIHILRWSFLIVLLFGATFSGFSQHYEISISIKSKNDTAYLTHIFAKDDPKKLYVDTVIVLKNGKGAFKGKKILPKGLYYIYNDNRRFQILIGENQKFGIETDTTDFFSRTRFTNSPDNDAFYAFMRHDIQRAAKSQQLNEQFKNAAGDAEKNAIRKQAQELNHERQELMQRLIRENEGRYVSKFLKTLMPLELPEPPKDEQGRVADSTFLYRWYRAHFFDHLNIYDPDMLRTPLYEDKLVEYLKWFSRNHPLDTICAENDRILAKAIHNKEVFRCVLAIIYTHYGGSDLMIRENIWVHLVDNWYVPHADWANVEEMKKNADKVRATLIGKPAPPLDDLQWLPPDHLKAAAMDTAIKNDIYAGKIIPDFRKNIQSKYLAIIFWDIGCSHCKKAMQELWEVYEACKDKGLQVIAIQVLQQKDSKAKWIDFVNEHGMYDWFNAWIIYNQKWRDMYETSVVPIIYLLNEKKEILFKRVQPEQIKGFVEATAKRN